MPDQIAHISTRGPLGRGLTLAPLALALAGTLFSVRWYIGDTIAEYTNPESRGLQPAQLAVSLAPDDPLAHWRLGDLKQNLFTPEQGTQAIQEFELATRLSPNDYRYWLPLGRALEQHGDIQKAELAMRRAVDLAPAYSYPRWYLGNVLLRSGHNAEGFAELRRASDADPQLRPQVFNLACEVYGQSFDELRAAIGPAVESRAQFAKYLFDRERVDDGLRMWSSLSAKEKEDSRTTGESLMKSLVEGKRFQQALEMWNDLAPGEAARTRVDQIMNAGFEIPGATTFGTFGWRWKSSPQMQVAMDWTTGHGSGRSLRILFQARSKIELDISQLVVVVPGSEYELSCFIKTNQLESAGLPIVEVLNAADDKVLGISQSAPADTNDWQAVVVPFKSDAKAEAIVVRISRASCGDNVICPIYGTVWYDDFSLKRKS